MKQNYLNHNFTFTSFFSGKILYPKNLDQLRKYIKRKYTIIGNLRSYGDSCTGNKNKISLKNFNKILKIDKQKKIVEVQSGVKLSYFYKELLKSKLVLKCAPGCKFVTIGGIIANDIHGKLIAKNNLKDHILSLKIINNKNKVITCSRYKNKKLFDLTIGGRGLTGPILSVKLKVYDLYSTAIHQKSLAFDNFTEFKKNLIKIKSYDYCVIWLDFAKQNFSGLIFVGKHISSRSFINEDKKGLKLPDLIIRILSLFISSKSFIYLFNYLFSLKNRIFQNRRLELYDFFFPQNKILNWNHVFKKRGFIQIHFYLKKDQILNLVEEIKFILKKNNIISNFTVIKIHEKKKMNKIQNFSISVDIPLRENSNKL